MSYQLRKYGLLRNLKGKRYFGYKVYGRSGMRYSRNPRIYKIMSKG